jgi:hypothetical protein
MLQEINASSPQLASTQKTNVIISAADSSNTSANASSTQAATDSTANISTSVQGDTVSISHMAMKSYTASSSASSSVSTSSSSSLSSYSESQLQQMLSDGKITQSEYNTELAKRQKQTSSSTQTTSDTQSLNSGMQ